MRIVLFTHPTFLTSTSMPLFAQMIISGMRSRGHSVQVWSPRSIASRFARGASARKWLGYIDQFVFFPRWVRRALTRQTEPTLYVFADQALGPWVPLVADRPHVVHCHDFLALRSALGEFGQNRVSATGRIYQRYIRRGFRQARRFIAVSESTRRDLHCFVPTSAAHSSVVYNGFNHPFKPMATPEAMVLLADQTTAVLADGFVLHVGGNQWYKNRAGVLQIYAAYVAQCDAPLPLPLLLMGAPPTPTLTALADRAKAAGGAVHFIVRPPTEVIEAAYSLARVLLFPSVAEGFGWPIIEAQACGCPVLTTAEAPMTEAGGEVAVYIPRMPEVDSDAQWAWADGCARELQRSLDTSPAMRASRREAGMVRSQQFDAQNTIAQYEAIYFDTLNRRPA